MYKNKWDLSEGHPGGSGSARCNLDKKNPPNGGGLVISVGKLTTLRSRTGRK